MSRRVADQTDLFAPAPDAAAAGCADPAEAPPDAAFLQRIRDELNGHLARARATTTGFPWRDLTETYLVELRVNSMSRWLPRAEAVVLRRSFAAEMDRLYEVADQERPEVWGADF